MRLIAIVLTLAVPLNVVVAVVIWRLASAATDAQRTSLLYTARSIAAAVDAELGKYIALGQVLSHDPALQEDRLDAFEGKLRESLSSVPNVWVLVADLQGRQLLNTAALQGQPLPPRTAEGIAAQSKAFETLSPTVSDIHKGSTTGKWTASTNISIFKDDEPFRSLAIITDVQAFLDLLAFQHVPKNWRAAIRDTQGRLVARVPDQDLWVGQLASERFLRIRNQDGLFNIMSRDGEEFLIANTHSHLSGWTIGIGVKTTELRAAVFSAIGWAIALGGVISLLSLIFAIRIARLITAPLTELRKKAEALLSDPQIRFEPGVPELAEVWATLRRAATTRYRSDAMLRRSEKRLSQIINTYNGYVGLLDRRGRITEVNVQMLKAIGTAREYLIGKSFSDVHWWTYSPDAQRDMRELIARCLAGETVRRDMQYAAHDGELRWIAFQATPLRTADGRIDGVIPSGYDITDRKRTEDALQKSEARFRNLYEHALAGISLSDWEGRIVACNPAFCDLVGYSEDELRGMHFAQLVHPDDRDENVAKVRGLRTGEAKAVVFENRFVHKSGKPVWVRKTISSLPAEPGQPAQFFMLCIGTGDRKQKEELLRRSEAQLQLALDAARLGWWLYDPVQLTASWNSRFKEIFGITDPDAAAPAVLAQLLPEDSARLCEAAAAALNDPLDSKPFVGEYRIRRGDGELRWIEVYGMATFEGAGAARNPVVMVGTAADITERKHAEERQHLLMRELSHRTKNLLSVVQSIANHTAASRPTGFVERFSLRIQALAASHDLLVRSDWLGVEIEDLVRAQLAHFADLIGDRITIVGPPASVTPVAAQSIGMALHELATNAGKYGSLSDDQGSVTIDWRVDNGEFSIGWIEHDGPRVKPPKRRGFGTTIISDVAQANIGGEVELSYESSGLIWRLRCSASKALSAGA